MSDLKMDMNNIIKKQEQVIDGLTTALKESLKLQSHYAGLLNIYDGGQRLQFDTISGWLERLENEPISVVFDELPREDSNG